MIAKNLTFAFLGTWNTIKCCFASKILQVSNEIASCKPLAGIEPHLEKFSSVDITERKMCRFYFTVSFSLDGVFSWFFSGLLVSLESTSPLHCQSAINIERFVILFYFIFGICYEDPHEPQVYSCGRMQVFKFFFNTL